MIERAKLLDKLNGWSVLIEKRHTRLGDLPFNVHGQTTNEACSFTYALAHLLSTSGQPFITALSEEASWYIGEQCAREYVEHVRLACDLNRVPIDGEVAETFALYATFERVRPLVQDDDVHSTHDNSRETN